jgi:hypothetical protein
MSAAVVMKRIAETSPRLKARMAGVFFLLTMLTAAFTELFVRVSGRLNFVADLAAGVVEISGMVAVTLLFYAIFKAVNRRLSLLAASVNLVALTFEAFQSLNIGPGLWRLLLPPDRLPDFQVDLPASNSGRADGVCRLGLDDFSVAADGRPSIPLQSGRRHPWGRIGDAVAPRDGGERSTMEGAGQRTTQGEQIMTAAVMMRRFTEASPGFKARMAAVLYFFSLLTAGFTETFVRGRLNYAGGYIAIAGMAAMTLISYDIFKPVNRSVSMIAVLFAFVGLTFEALRLQPQGLNIALVFHGFYCILLGYLIFRSTFLPRILGALMAFAGLGWLTYLSTPVVNHLSPYNLASGLLGDVSVYLWLLVMGLNVQRWAEQANWRSPRATN